MTLGQNVPIEFLVINSVVILNKTHANQLNNKRIKVGIALADAPQQ